MSPRTIRAALAATAVVFATLTSRAEEAADALRLVRTSFEQQTGEELSGELARNVFRMWRAFEKRGLTRTTDRPPSGALVFYHTPYGASGRLAVSNGDGTILLAGERIALDTIPGRLGWVDAPRIAKPLDVAPVRTATLTGANTTTTGASTTTTGTNDTTAGDPTKSPGGSATRDGLPVGPTRPRAAAGPNFATENPRPVTTNATGPADAGPANFSTPGGSTPGASNPGASNPGASNQGLSNPVSGSPASESPGFSSGPRNTGSSSAASNTGNAATAPQQPPADPNFRPTTGSSFEAKGTGYYPANTRMEGGFKDRKGKPLQTLQDFLAGRSPFVSVAMDVNAFPYGTKLRIKEFEAKYGREIEFRVVDTGGAFKNKGTTRIDICTANERASLDATVNGMLHCEVVR